MACNLLNPHVIGPDMVLQIAQTQASKVGAVIVDAYTTGPSEEELIQRYECENFKFSFVESSI